MKISEVLVEATYGKVPKEIAKKINDIVFPRMLKAPSKKLFEDITEFFSEYGEVEVKFFYWPNADKTAVAETVNAELGYDIHFYESLADDLEEAKEEGVSIEELKESYQATIEHEVIHVLDLIRSGGKKTTRNLIDKKAGIKSKKDWNNKVGLNNKEGFKEYYKSKLEMNRLLNQVVEFFKDHLEAVDKKIINKEALIKFISVHETKEVGEVFNETPELYRKLIERLNREGVLPRNFK